MASCPSCGAEIDDDARFCPKCGTPQPVAAPETRRQVTILFCDVVESTALGSSLDPEVLRAAMARYFTVASAAVERHGGTVEKFIGDAVMAVFGLPELHEDDALRALRAAVEIRDAVRPVSEDLQRHTDRLLAVRIGVNTGEVVAGEASTRQQLVTGETVNVAARLEAAAAAGEILLGPLTERLVRRAATLQQVGPLELKGLPEPLTAFRLESLDVGVEATRARTSGTFVGREHELAQLAAAFDDAVGAPRCHLVTVVGPPGIGKSRLVDEFIASVSDRSTVVSGRCLPYGDGITYWPIALVAKAAAGIEEDDTPGQAWQRLGELAGGFPDGDRIAAALASAIGLDAGTQRSREEIGWAVRRLLEGLSQRAPVIAVVDDIQWGEPTLLDLLESIAVLSQDRPIVLLCMARPDLADVRPGWGAGAIASTRIRLEPLPAEASDALVASLTESTSLPAAILDRIHAAAEGNPLFIEELMAMLIDDGVLRRDGPDLEVVGDPEQISVPPTIQALLAARLDRLASADRAAAQRASVVGRTFERGALMELSPPPERPQVENRLVSLVRRELIRPDVSGLDGDETFRFRHLLIRDAAYAGLPKRERAELHGRFAHWLTRMVGERLAEFEEIVGYHLEQAYQYRRELEGDDPEAGGDLASLGLSAAEHLGKAAYRSLDRSDLPAAGRLLRRALKLLPYDDARRAEWMADLVDVHVQLGQLEQSATLVEELGGGPSTDPVSHAWYLVAKLNHTLYAGSFSSAQAEGLAEAASRTFAEVENHRGMARTWVARAHAEWYQVHGGPAVEWLSRAAEHARRARRRSDELGVVGWLIRALAWGPTPASSALRELNALEQQVRGDRRTEANLARARALLIGMGGSHREARSLHERSIALFEELGMALEVGESAQSGYYLAMWAGDPATGRRWLEQSCELLARHGESGLLPTNAIMLATALVEEGDRDAATGWLQRALDTASSEDTLAQAQARGVMARMLAERGDTGEAARLAAEALDLVGDQAGTDFWIDADVMSDVAYVHQAAGQTDAAIALLERARARCVQKESLVEAARLAERIAALRAEE